MNYSELLQLAKGWGNFKFYRIIIWRLRNYAIFDVSNDEVFNKLLELFEGKTGNTFNTEEKLRIEQEGEERYKEKTPPGYKDNKKPENKYGDLLVWKEILRYAKVQGVDVIFVTHDQKEDWWNINHGKNIGPRIELRKEFYEETGKKFHMYTMSSFLSFFIQNKGKDIDKTTIDEVDLFASIINKNVSPIELMDYYGAFAGEKEKAVVRLKFEIATIVSKNEKRKKQISVLQKKEKRGQLSAQERTALKGNKKNLIDGEDKLEQLNEQLSYLMSV